MMKKPRARDEAPSNVAAGPPEPLCWERDPNSQALRVELNGDACFVFPYAHLSFAKLDRVGVAETLSLMFTTHEIRITGRRLRDLLLAVQKLSAEWVKEMPSRYSALIQKNSPFIETISVTEVSERL